MKTPLHRIRAGALAAALCLALASCGAAPESTPGSPTTAAPNANGETSIRIVIGDSILRGTVWHNPTGRSLLDRLPVTVRMSDHRGQEKGGPLAAPLTMVGMPAGADPQAGDLGYFSPAADLVLYYGDAPYWAGIARIGRINGDMSPVANAADGTPVTVERAD